MSLAQRQQLAQSLGRLTGQHLASVRSIVLEDPSSSKEKDGQIELDLERISSPTVHRLEALVCAGLRQLGEEEEEVGGRPQSSPTSTSADDVPRTQETSEYPASQSHAAIGRTTPDLGVSGALAHEKRKRDALHSAVDAEVVYGLVTMAQTAARKEGEYVAKRSKTAPETAAPRATKNEFRCGACKRLFRCQGELKNHERTHTGEKPHKCSYDSCAAAFAHRSNLLKHERGHLGIRSFKCPCCDKAYRHPTSLKEHLAKVHKGEVIHCFVYGCGAIFVSQPDYLRHIGRGSKAHKGLPAAPDGWTFCRPVSA